MNKESWYASKLSDMDVVRISDIDGWVVDYDKSRGMYRVSYFRDNHFVDEHWFDAYEEGEVDDRIEKIIDGLEEIKICFKEKNKPFSVKGMIYFLDKTINWIKNLK